MSLDALDPSTSPSELSNKPTARRLSKLPAMLIIGVVSIVLCLLAYSILTRGQPQDEVVVEEENESDQIETTLVSANDIIKGQDKSLFQRPVLPEKKPLKEPENETPPAPTIVTLPAPIRPEAPIEKPKLTPEEKFAEKVARLKEQLLLDALGSKTLAAEAPDNKEEDTGSDNRLSSLPAGIAVNSNGRDRAAEQQQIKASLAGNQQKQTSPELEKIATLLSTIAKNTSQPNQRDTSPNKQEKPQRLNGLEALSAISQGQSNGVPSGNTGLFQNGLASRPSGNTGLFQNGLASRPSGNTGLFQNGLASRPSGNPKPIAGGRLSGAQEKLLALANDSPAGTFVEAKRQYGYSTEAPRSQLTNSDLRVGTIIPAILINGINSELEGVAIAQVSQNVWDSTHGEHVLIPQGTRLIGEFKSDIKEGQSRVGVSWHRLQFPDGRTLSLSEMFGSDQAGFTGFSDVVNNHYKKKFGSATLLSIISGLGSVFASNDERSTNGESFTNQIAKQYSDVGSAMIKKNLDIAPTIIIRPGYRFNVIVTKDFVLEPYYN